MLIQLVLFTLSAFAFEASEPKLVRVLDGRNVPCKESFEVGKMTYNPKVASLSLSESALTGELGLAFVTCTMRGENEFALEPRAPLAPREYLDDEGKPVRIEYRDPDFYLGDADFLPVFQVALTDAQAQTVSFSAPLDKALSPADRKAFAEGKPVRARLAFMVRRIAMLVKDGRNTPLGQLFLGSFTFFVTLKR